MKKMNGRNNKKKSFPIVGSLAGLLAAGALFAVCEKIEDSGDPEISAKEPREELPEIVDSLSQTGEIGSILAEAQPISDLPPPELSIAKESHEVPKVKEEHHSYWTLGANYTRVRCKPASDSAFLGNLGGAQGSYEYRPSRGLYAGLLTGWKQGHMKDSSVTRSLLYIDVQERIGYTVTSENGKFISSLFTGLGYRHLGQKLPSSSGGTLHFRYNDLYIPVGWKWDYMPNDRFRFGLDAVWMPQAYPTVAIVPLKGARWVLTNTLSNISVKMPFDFTLTKDRRFHLIVNPFYEYWQDGHSTAKTSSGLALNLPGNTYNFFGGELNFLYTF